MASLSIEKLIKILLGVFVVVAVVIALYMSFENQVISFFDNIFGSV